MAANSNGDRLNQFKRLLGRDPDRPRRPFLRRCQPFGELVEGAETGTPPRSSYRGLWTPGPWLVEWEGLPDGRVAYWIDDPEERYQAGHALRYSANAKLMEHALELHAKLDVAIDLLFYCSLHEPDATRRQGYEALMGELMDLRDRANGAVVAEGEWAR